MNNQWIFLCFALIAGLGAHFILDARNPSLSTERDYPLNFLETANAAVDLYDTDDKRVRVVYFGFTQCPDVCPTSLAVMSSALKQLPQDQLEHIWPIFISLDPERDTADNIAQYAQHFHPSITGVVGTEKQTEALASKYGVLYLRTELEDSAMQYTIDHNSYFYFLSPEGELIKKVPHSLNHQRLLAALSDVAVF